MSSSKKQPEFLKEGDIVAIISPSFCVDEKKVEDAVIFLEKWGLKVVVGRNAFKRNGPFAGTDEERLTDLQEMTNSDEIKAIFCARGGYGVSKIINKVDFSGLMKKPKWYIGFSDITVLHMWLSEVCGIISIHGEMPLNYSNTDKTEETFVTLKNALYGCNEPVRWEGNFFASRDAEGVMTGGNLSLLYGLTGTPAEPATEGNILFIEDVGEQYYHIDRMLTSLKLANKLKGLSALLVGGMNKIGDTKISWPRSIEETIFDIVKEYNYPVLFNFPAGHIPDNRSFYIGKKAKIRVSEGSAELVYAR
jgi:muramoyltetrapeptide carboxypeptidase